MVRLSTSVRCYKIRYLYSKSSEGDPHDYGQVEQKAVDNLRQRSGDVTAQALRQLLSRQNFRDQWSKMVRADGLQPNDVIDIGAAEWVLDWIMVNHADNT